MRIRLMLLVVAAVAVPSPAGAAPAVTVRPVAFEVENVNGSALDCEADTKPYVIRGEVVGPTGLLARPPEEITATLYLHEFSFGRFFWRFDDVPGYDFATAMARDGHVSVVIDRLGYDGSDHPEGTGTCLGAQADVVAQVVRQLPFGRVVLAGHSVGGGVAELAAHSFDDLGLEGLALFGWADQGYSPQSVQQSLAQGSDCQGGGEDAEEGGPPGYAYFGRTEADFQGNMFTDADPRVVERATALRNRDPCGDNGTLARMAAVNAANVGGLELPVLLLSGEHDPVFAPGAFDVQAGLFRSSPEVTTQSFDAAHALTLERVAPAVQAAMDGWLTHHGLISAPAGAPRATTSTSTTSTTTSPTTPTTAATAQAQGNTGAPAPTLPATGGEDLLLPGLALTAAATLLRRGRAGAAPAGTRGGRP